MKCSVCVPTYRRPASLARALDRLVTLEAPDGGYEIVVVDDGSPADDGVRAVLERAAATSPVPFRWEAFAANQGAAAARNRAWHQAVGEWIAFTDDDCLPERDWLVQLMAAAEEGEGAIDIVQGRTRPDSARAHLLSKPFTRSLKVDSFNELYQTCNIAYRRSMLERLDGFDESFRLACDDTDLGWRALAAGAVAAFATDAVVEHEVVEQGWRGDLYSRRRWSDVAQVLVRHPAARRLAWHPYIYKKTHVPVIAAAASLPLLASRTGRRTWCATVVGALTVEAARAGSAAALADRLRIRAIDAYETAVVVQASARRGTVLL
jgi:glycosyltransferase involved in cell wall biosynthesis